MYHEEPLPAPRQRSISSSSALSALAAFSRKHLVPPTPGTSSPEDHRPESREPFSPTPSPTYRAATSIMGGPARRDSETYLTTPEEERGHTAPLKRLTPAPTIQEIASGMVTRSPHALPLIGSRSSSSSLSSTPSSPTLPPIPLRSSLKKTLTVESATRPPLPLNYSLASRRITNHSAACVVCSRKITSDPPRHPTSQLDDTGSFRSDGSDSTKRIIGRVRFSDTEGGSYNQLSRRVTSREKSREKSHRSVEVEDVNRVSSLPASPRRSSADSPATTVNVTIPGSTGGPGKLNLTPTRKMMKMLHIGAP
ncbi:hypothetical protein BS47DRAFT_1379274 [Hydnum rufescens UP504]|uniref:Uncharacterized protein n=1 Tax=Hydnum rufescens UP504 TaxID=1448309 RepID=A0A9P6B818_9AGAM|nr:hypothetical protein BS47DRAFT_1379274 [Hydnum rufescens UP504]